jgi:hypothetical protein
MNLAFVYLTSFERTAAGVRTDDEMWNGGAWYWWRA